MESSGECRGCQRNIKFAVKQARLCRTCYNKTYLTSQKRREYYKNKKKRREIHTTSSVEPAIDVHQRRHNRPIKKEEDGPSHRSPPRRHLPDNLGQDPVAAHLYLLNYHHHQSHHTPSSCSDCVPLGGSLFEPTSPTALSLAALAHASQHHGSSSSPASPSTSSQLGSSLTNNLSSATTSSVPSSPSSSPPLSMLLPYQQLRMQHAAASFAFLLPPAQGFDEPAGHPHSTVPFVQAPGAATESDRSTQQQRREGAPAATRSPAIKNLLN